MLRQIKNQVKGTRLEQVLGPLYIYGKYFISGGYGFRYELDHGVEIMTPIEWAGINHEQKREFFGYYDKTPWSSDRTSFLTHSIKEDGKVDIVMYDRESNSRRILADTSAWNYQQGAMIQWVSKSTIIFNDIIDDELVARIVSTEGEEESILSYPIQTRDSQSNTFLSLNYKRLDNLDPQYGYNTQVDNFDSRQDSGADGIWKVDINSHESKLILTLDQLQNLHWRSEMSDSKHHINHIMFSPNGSKFVFMHRWVGPAGRFSRLYVANADGSNLRLLMDDQLVSHYSWKNNTELIVWGHGPEGDLYYLLNVQTGEMDVINGGLNRYGDGHPSYSPNERWVVTDTYANDARVRHLLLHDTESSETVEIGKFHSPIRYRGEKSCDLHPRWSPDGTMISIDSTHEGQRSTYLIDVSNITNV